MLEMRTVLRALFERLQIEPSNAHMEIARWRTVIVAPGGGCRVVLRKRPAVPAVFGDAIYK